MEVKLQNYFSTIWEPKGRWGLMPKAFKVELRRERREAAQTVTVERRAAKEAALVPTPDVDMHDGYQSDETQPDEAIEERDSGSEGEMEDEDQQVITDSFHLERDDFDTPIPREDLYEGRVCWGWEIDLKTKHPETRLRTSQETYFAVVLLEDPDVRVSKVRCMCLAEAPGALGRYALAESLAFTK